MRIRPTRSRRAFLRNALAGTAGLVLSAQMSGCAAFSSRDPVAEPTPEDSQAPGSKRLLVYFSRAGKNYYYGERTRLTVGNTEVLAGMISGLVACDVHRIERVDPYSDDYQATVRRNVQEQESNARPAIANPLASIGPYDTVLLGSPIWNVRAPTIMSTFVESLDFTGKTIFPFTTYAVSEFGNSYSRLHGGVPRRDDRRRPRGARGGSRGCHCRR